jgi:small subunit ribosomal protein S16
MLKIRLKRFGRKKQPSYRVVLMENRTRRDGAPIEEFGFYDPINKTFKVNKENILKRLSQGAKPTETVKNLLIKTQVL